MTAVRRACLSPTEVEQLIAATPQVWCYDCRSQQAVEDVFDEGHMERRGEVAYLVRILDCGHATHSIPDVVGPAPGEPYAPDVARSLHPVDLRTVRGRDTDPWADA